MATWMDDGETLDVPRCRDSRQIGGRLAGAGGRRSWDEIDMRLQTMGINGITLAHKLPLALSPGRCVAISAPASSLVLHSYSPRVALQINPGHPLHRHACHWP